MISRIGPCWWIEDRQCACPKGEACPSPGKHPISRHGVHDFTSDPDEIAALRQQHPKANWAIATGDEFFVVDLDRKPGKDGIQTIRALGTLPPTRTVRTGSGGLHLYYRGTCSNSAGRIGPGVDTRGVNGYVMAPGSNHISGGRYDLVKDVEPAEAPPWLVERIRAPALPSPAPAPDSPAVSAARAALAHHGPAVEGQGGDQHTFVAAAILTHDYALSEAEAWPLLVEWNATCQPPWSEPELRAKLQGGDRYASGERGAKRPFDASESIDREISAWQAGGTGAAGIGALMQAIRPLVARLQDPSVAELVMRRVEAATGIRSQAQALPKVYLPPRPLNPGEIMVTSELHRVANESVTAIAPSTYQRAGVLCEVVTGDRTFIHDLDSSRIQDLMSASARYVKTDGKGIVTAIAPPPQVAQIIESRRDHPPVRVLDAVTTAPIFLADGSILSTKGYNAEARVYLDPSVVVQIPDSPDRIDAQAAVDVFRDLLCDYKLQGAEDFSAWLAALLSPLVKSATHYAPAPLIVISASSAGAGKTLLAEIIARIVTGASAEIRPYNVRDTGEWSKRLTAFVRAGSPVSVFDNINGALGDEALDRLITSSTWSDRVLGASDAPPVTITTTWIATGNNVEPVGDTVRRCLPVRVLVDVEKPQERTDFKREDLLGYVQENRADLLGAALTILRAYHVAGRPAQSLAAWGSFQPWSSLVRGALVWAGCADPFLTQQRLSRDQGEPENEIHDFWMGIVEGSDGSPADIAARANQADAGSLLGAREEINAYRLRRFLGRFIDKPRSGKRIVREGGAYRVMRI